MKSPLFTLEPSRAISLIELQIQRAENLRALESNDPARTEWASTSRGLLIAGFTPLDRIVFDFDRCNLGTIGPHSSASERQKRSNKNLDGSISVLKSALEQLGWELPPDFQHFIPSGSQHDVFQLIRSIIQSTKNDITIANNYVDETTWTLLTNVAAQVRIQILTMNMKGDFALEGKLFIAQRGNAVEVRKTEQLHDRFIIADCAAVWLLGSSTKDAGSKTTFMSEMRSPTIVATAIGDINNLWNAATVVAI